MYATQTDLERAKGEAQIIALTDRADPPAGVADADVIAQALGGASSTIDGYLRGRYAVPLQTVPDEIRDACIKLAFYALHVNGVYPEGVQRDYDVTLRWLRDIANGLVVLSTDAAPAAEKDADLAQVEGAAPAFTNDTMKGFG
jgi:phage gp36-like protein